MSEPHAWNVTPVMPAQAAGAIVYRLMMVQAKERVIATAERQAPLVVLQHQLEELGFVLHRLERLAGAR
jgi:hypothetical protein